MPEQSSEPSPSVPDSVADSVEPDVSDESTLERFARLYGTPERGRRLWNQWMNALELQTRGIMEQLATDTALHQQITNDEARTLLAMQKLVQDRGPRFVERFLEQEDARILQGDRALRAMSLPQKRKKNR